MREIEVRGDHITLGQLVQVLGIAGSGGGAKQYLSEHAVMVNGEPESRRGRKLRPGDNIGLLGIGTIRLVANRQEADGKRQ